MGALLGPQREDLERLVKNLATDAGSDFPPAVQKAIELAGRLQTRGVGLQTPQERRQQRELERMLSLPEDKTTLVEMTDQAFRSQNARRSADQLVHILDVQGVPRFFGAVERAMLKGFQSFGGYLPGVAIPLVKEKMREETANVVLPAEKELLTTHLENRRQNGLRMNVNYLGEALLGETDARKRLDNYLAALQIPTLEVISVKISTLYSQIQPIAHEAAIGVLCDRLELLFRAASKAHFEHADGRQTPKFVYLDMEEYRDLYITLEAFMRTLDRPGLEQTNAGIALQAYLPDSDHAQRELLKWARARIVAGKAPVTMRIVKGANMEMERVEASIKGWPQAPYTSKVDTDANFKRMLERGLEPENARAVHVGVASHNLFDVAYAVVLSVERGVLEQVQFEMLEGMANHQRRALYEMVPSLLLYAPATYRADFVNAIGYLIRRLDENTGPENFLRHAFKLKVGSKKWEELKQGFLKSFSRITEVAKSPRRTQDRRLLPARKPHRAVAWPEFVNEPDTDFSLRQNIEWAKSILDDWRGQTGDLAAEVPVIVDGNLIQNGREVRVCYDPSHPGVVVSRCRQGNQDDLRRAISCAVDDPSGWRHLAEEERGSILGCVADELRRSRGVLMGAALVEGGKILVESDPEVSEAVDFVEYYAKTASEFRRLGTVQVKPKGVVAVVTPWNFPIAIPCGGIAAGLAAGNTVILKPASETVLVAYKLCQAFWRAGVPQRALQFLPCPEKEVASELVASLNVNTVVFTGGTNTATKVLSTSPRMDLLAETGGKNATVVTAMSDRELAIKHVVQSAFGHAGQKCSATSLLVLEAEVYDDASFRETLCDAVRSLKVGSAWKLDTRIGPLIHAPSGTLDRALHELEDGESWAVLPHRLQGNPNLWSPGVKWGVRPGSYTHLTEFFGPVLAVLRAENLEDAVDIVNQTGYGLTSGLESLDPREQQQWREQVRAGNLYINRGTTGAIVSRQPFGGMGRSAFGPGIKAGGPNYVAQLMDFQDRQWEPGLEQPLESPELETLRKRLTEGVADEWLGEERDRLLGAMVSYSRHFREEFSLLHDHARLVGQDNLRLYLPVTSLRIRLHPDDSAFELFARVCAAKTAGCQITVSWPGQAYTPWLKLLDHLTETWGGDVEFVEESDQDLSEIIRDAQTDRVRYAAPDRIPATVLEAAIEPSIYLARAPVLAEGRIELLWYLREQNISHDYHRYGNLGVRAKEVRSLVL